MVKSDTKSAIIDAATHLFGSHGYSTVSLRQIARVAEVEPSIIIRHFGSKEELFLQAVRTTICDNIKLNDGDTFGKDLLAQLFDDSDRPSSVLHSVGVMLRACDSPAVQVQARQTITDLLVEPIKSMIAASDSELRARLIASQVIGLIVQLFVIEDQHLTHADRDRIAVLYGKAIDTLIRD